MLMPSRCTWSGIHGTRPEAQANPQYRPFALPMCVRPGAARQSVGCDHGAACALAELRRSGAVRAIGVGVNEADVCARFARAADFDCMIMAGCYSRLRQDGLDEFLPLAQQKGVRVILAGVFNSGILAEGP